MSNFYEKDYYKDSVDTAPEDDQYFELKAKDLEGHFLRSLMDLSPGDKVLDVGCGYGYFLSSVKDTGAELWGIDIAQSAIDICKRRLKQEEQLICASAIPLPFEDQTFDVVTAWGVVEHFESIPDILSQMNRVLKPDGKT